MTGHNLIRRVRQDRVDVLLVALNAIGRSCSGWRRRVIAERPAVTDAQAHFDQLETQIDPVAKVGEQNFLQTQVGMAAERDSAIDSAHAPAENPAGPTPCRLPCVQF